MPSKSGQWMKEGKLKIRFHEIQKFDLAWKRRESVHPEMDGRPDGSRCGRNESGTVMFVKAAREFH